MPAAHFVRGGANDQKLLIEKRNDLEAGFGNGERDKGQIEAAIEQAGNHLLGDANGHANLRVGKALSKLSEGTAQLVDQCRDTGGEMEGANVLGQVVFKSLLDMAHHGDNLFGEFSKALGRRCRNQAFAAAHKEFRLKLISELMQLEADGTG